MNQGRTNLKLVSGGQAGADRAALDFALEHQLPYGGWCPAGRLAEDGPIPARYRLTESSTANYAERTESNVRESDGTVIFSIAPILTGGSNLTLALARKRGKPVLHLFRDGGAAQPHRELLRFIRENQIQILNVAGPRASEEPQIAEFVREVLERLWTSD